MIVVEEIYCHIDSITASVFGCFNDSISMKLISYSRSFHLHHAIYVTGALLSKAVGCKGIILTLDLIVQLRTWQQHLLR